MFALIQSLWDDVDIGRLLATLAGACDNIDMTNVCVVEKARTPLVTTMFTVGGAVVRTDNTAVNRRDNTRCLNKTNHVCLLYVLRIVGTDH